MSAPLQKLGEVAWREDKFDGVIIDMEETSRDVKSHDAFSSALGMAILKWRDMKKRGIWLSLHKKSAHLIPPACDHGFEFHHTRGEILTMTLWLPESDPNTLPNASTHQVGIGAVVFNSRGELLTVVERNGPLRGKGIFKLPTGLCDPGEDINDSAVREVMEETGLVVKFESVLAIRQAHGFSFGNSDMFILTALSLVDEGQEIKAQESEIEEARWMPLSDYVAQECWKGHEVMQRMSEVITSYAAGKYKGMRGDKLTAGSLYSNAKNRSDLLLTIQYTQ